MLQTIKLLLPALMPSWRFFAAIAPSPRIEFAVLKSVLEEADNWQEFRPRPKHLSIGSMLKRMVYNPHWNETLYLVRSAELYTTDPTEHSNWEILTRIRAELNKNVFDHTATPYLQFRLVFVHRRGDQLLKNLTYISPIHPSFEDVSK